MGSWTEKPLDEQRQKSDDHVPFDPPPKYEAFCTRANLIDIERSSDPTNGTDMQLPSTKSSISRWHLRMKLWPFRSRPSTAPCSSQSSSNSKMPASEPAPGKPKAAASYARHDKPLQLLPPHPESVKCHCGYRNDTNIRSPPLPAGRVYCKSKGCKYIVTSTGYSYHRDQSLQHLKKQEPIYTSHSPSLEDLLSKVSPFEQKHDQSLQHLKKQKPIYTSHSPSLEDLLSKVSPFEQKHDQSLQHRQKQEPIYTSYSPSLEDLLSKMCPFEQKHDTTHPYFRSLGKGKRICKCGHTQESVRGMWRFEPTVTWDATCTNKKCGKLTASQCCDCGMRRMSLLGSVEVIDNGFYVPDPANVRCKCGRYVNTTENYVVLHSQGKWYSSWYFALPQGSGKCACGLIVRQDGTLDSKHSGSCCTIWWRGSSENTI